MTDNGYCLSRVGSEKYWTKKYNRTDGEIPPINEQRLLFFLDSLLDDKSLAKD